MIRSVAMKKSCVLGAVAACTLLPAGWAATSGCGQIIPDASDAVIAAPEHHKVILENDRVRVLEATVPLHSHEPPHTHPWPSVFFEEASAPSEPWQTVNIRWSAGGPSKGFESSDRYRHNLLVEVKRADCQPAPLTGLPPSDAMRIHDSNFIVVLENAYVRVLSARIPPGEKEPWHTHTWPAVVIYFHLPASVRMTPDGARTPRPELKQMQVTFDPNPQPLHSIENLGPGVFQAYRVELKPTSTLAAAKTTP